MPGQDRSGPMGQGPRTGRGMGLCNGSPQVFQRGFGRGCRWGFGRGFGRRYFYPDSESITLTKEQERKILEAEIAEIEAQKSEAEKRLKELE